MRNFKIPLYTILNPLTVSIMKKIKKVFTHSLGAFLAFIFERSNAFAQIEAMYGVEIMAEYGVSEPYSEPTLWEKILSIILSPIFIVIIAALALIVGIVVFIKRKKKKC